MLAPLIILKRSLVCLCSEVVLLPRFPLLLSPCCLHLIPPSLPFFPSFLFLSCSFNYLSFFPSFALRCAFHAAVVLLMLVSCILALLVKADGPCQYCCPHAGWGSPKLPPGIRRFLIWSLLEIFCALSFIFSTTEN